MSLLENNISKSKLVLYWFLVWTTLGILQTFRLYYVYNVYETIVSWQRAMLWAMSEWYLWGLLAIFMYKFILWLDNYKKSKSIKISSFLVGLAVVPPLHLYLYSVVWFVTRDFYPVDIGSSYESPFDIFTGSYLGKVNDNSVAYFLIVATIYAFTYYKRLFLEQKRVAEVNKMLVEAKLEQLKTQLQPHFLFNTLNTITSLIHSDPERADLMTTKLSDLLRISLDSESVQEVPLHKEITFLEKYLDIQKIRFEERMEVVFNIASETTQLIVPYLILQPLVENAVKHSVSKSSEKVTIQISSAFVDNLLEIRIRNSGASLPEDYQQIISERKGIQNSVERLKQLYQDKASLTIQNTTPSGVEVKLCIPIVSSKI